MSETNSEEKSDVTQAKLESSAEHAKQAINAASEATKTVGETVKRQAQSAYETGREHLTAAAKDVSDAAAAKYEAFRGQAKTFAEDYKGRAQSAWSDASVKAQNVRAMPRLTSDSYPLKAVGIALGVGFLMGVLFRR